LADASFSLKKGEILGFFGLEGSGTEKFSRMIYGLEGRDGGRIYFKGGEITDVTPTAMVGKKILYLNNNRKLAGLLPDMPTTDNIAMPILRGISKCTFIDFKTLQSISESYVKKFSIAIPNVKTKPRNLSGGNQQKVMLTICLAAEPELLIVNDPTRGIDVGAKAEIHKLLLAIADQGVGIIIFSSELPELMGLADRIVVMKRRTIAGELSGKRISESAIMALATAEDAGKGSGAS
jgi:ABC-type sugar transport system ATPase subunit